MQTTFKQNCSEVCVIPLSFRTIHTGNVLLLLPRDKAFYHQQQLSKSIQFLQNAKALQYILQHSGSVKVRENQNSAKPPSQWFCFSFRILFQTLILL